MLDTYPNPDNRELLPFYLRKIGENYLSAFPIITSILALPIYFLALFLNVGITWSTLAVLAHLSGALISALSASFIYILFAKTLGLDAKKSMLLTTIYAFATVNFAQVSQGMWQHGTVQLFTILALIFYIKYVNESKLNYLCWFGLFSGIAILSRPTAVLPFVILCIFLALNTRGSHWFKIGSQVLIGLLIPAAFFIWYNQAFYLNIGNQGYSNQILRNWLGDFPFSFFGVWLSPSKGILVYSSVFIFSILGFIKSLKSSDKFKSFYIASFLIVFLHTLIISFWKHWFGGWSFGYRLSSDILPFLIILLVPWVTSEHSMRTWKIFYITVALSVLVQLSGMVFFDGVWHAAYDRGYKDTRWLWSIKDSEAVFNVRRVLVKTGYLEKACPICSPR